MSQYSNADFWNRNNATGTIVAGAVAAVVNAYRIRHACHEHQPRRTDLSGRVSEVAREVVGDNPLEAGREFLVAQVIPEFKPALLMILREFEEVVEDAVKRSEQVIKKL